MGAFVLESNSNEAICSRIRSAIKNSAAVFSEKPEMMNILPYRGEDDEFHEDFIFDYYVPVHVLKNKALINFNLLKEHFPYVGVSSGRAFVYGTNAKWRKFTNKDELKKALFDSIMNELIPFLLEKGLLFIHAGCSTKWLVSADKNGVSLYGGKPKKKKPLKHVDFRNGIMYFALAKLLDKENLFTQEDVPTPAIEQCDGEEILFIEELGSMVSSGLFKVYNDKAVIYNSTMEDYLGDTSYVLGSDTSSIAILRAQRSGRTSSFRNYIPIVSKTKLMTTNGGELTIGEAYVRPVVVVSTVADKTENLTVSAAHHRRLIGLDKFPLPVYLSMQIVAKLVHNGKEHVTNLVSGKRLLDEYFAWTWKGLTAEPFFEVVAEPGPYWTVLAL